MRIRSFRRYGGNMEVSFKDSSRYSLVAQAPFEALQLNHLPEYHIVKLKLFRCTETILSDGDIEDKPWTK